MESSQKNDKAEEGMRTRRRENMQVHPEAMNSPVQLENNETIDRRKESISVSDFDKTKLEKVFSE